MGGPNEACDILLQRLAIDVAAAWEIDGTPEAVRERNVAKRVCAALGVNPYIILMGHGGEPFKLFGTTVVMGSLRPAWTTHLFAARAAIASMDAEPYPPPDNVIFVAKDA